LINTVYFMAVLLIFLRMLTFFIIVPVFFPKGTPNIMKIVLAGVIAFILVPGIDTTKMNNLNSNYILVLSFVNEVVNGLLLGYVTNLCFMVIRMAGQLMDTQIGFSMISIFDPNSNSNVTLLERLLYWMSLLLFFMVDGHHMLIRALIESFKVVGLGKSMLGNNTIMLVVNVFTQYFTIGVKIAIPIILILLITEITMGLIARTVPSLNVMILGMPVKILVGLACFSIALPMLSNAIIHLFNSLPDIYKGIFHASPLMFVLASGEKTEDATPKKKRDARRKGQIAKSKEVPLAIGLGTATLVLATLSGYIGDSLLGLVRYCLTITNVKSFNDNSILNMTSVLLLKIGLIILPLIVPIMIMGVAGNYLQTGAMFTGEPLVPKLSKLNPLNGFKRIFSIRTSVDTLKDIALVSLVGYIGYSYLKGNYFEIFNMGNLSVGGIPPAFRSLVLGIFFRITIVMIIIAIIDYSYQRYMYNKDLRMTKQEVKEEYKQEEGDPQIKAKIRQKQRELSTRRMMQAVPEATVVITNPTHISVALKYNDGDEAPSLIAKGSGHVAIKIKEIAKENKVPIIENKPLARLIFAEVEVDEKIPPNMFQAVAEILALIYKMKKKKRR